jgi:hypothetical protein
MGTAACGLRRQTLPREVTTPHPPSGNGGDAALEGAGNTMQGRRQGDGNVCRQIVGSKEGKTKERL